MPRSAPHIEDPELANALNEALQRGALSLSDASRSIRAFDGETQAEFAARAGVATKVVKELESATGNPTLVSLNRIGALVGLQVGFVRPSASISIGTAGQVIGAESRARQAGLLGLRRGKESLKRMHARNALSGSDFKIKMAKMR
ncbi:MAG: helix-turn-helix domain-containing protein [Pyrinomonadaceae bacterium]